MKHKKVLASILALASLSTLTPLTAFAAEPTQITPASNPPTGNMEVSYDVAAAYTVTIPAAVTLGDTEQPANITAESVMLPEGQKISVKLTAATNTTSGSTFNAKAGESAVTYTIQNGSKAVALGDEVAALDKDNLTSTLTFAKDENAAPTFAGKHTEQLTFTIAVADAEVGNVVDLSTLTADYEAQNGDILTGTLGANVKITVAAGASITLKDAAINGVNSEAYNWAGITPLGDATITLEGSNTVKGFCADYAGIFAPESSTLTIQGGGTLDASSNGSAAGIGGGLYISCGNIVVKGGNITATGGGDAAGIGGGYQASCGDITIDGGTIIAAGGYDAAGIGGGADCSCGDITIDGGTITATGGDNAAGIGGGDCGSCGDIIIANTVTSVTATKGEDAPHSIGKGDAGDCGTVTIGGTEGAIEASPYTYTP